MFGPKIKVSKPLYERLKKQAEFAGYRSTDAFIIQALENELARLEDVEAESMERVEDRLKGLGYL